MESRTVMELTENRVVSSHSFLMGAVLQQERYQAETQRRKRAANRMTARARARFSTEAPPLAKS